MGKKIVIIGAGISGLVAGVYALKQGFEAEIFESLPNAGGECTGWERNGYHIDGCIDWLTGAKPGSDLYDIWETAGAIGSGVKIHNHEYKAAYNDNGVNYYLYNDPERLRGELLKLSPEDKQQIDWLIKAVIICGKMSAPSKKPMDMMSIIDKLRLVLSYMPVGAVYKVGAKITVKEFLERFKSEKIKLMLSCVIPPEYSAMALLFTIGGMCSGDGGWPMGGSAAFADRIKEKFLSLGGKLNLNTRVSRIIIENGRAVGVSVGKEGAESTIPADFVVSAVDARVLLDKLLDGKYHDKFFEERYGNPDIYPLMSLTSVYLGVNADLSSLPHFNIFKSSKEIDVGGGMEQYIAFKHFCYDPYFTQNGKSSVTVSFMNTTYDYWKRLKTFSEQEYRREKQRLADDVIAQLAAQYPEFSNTTEMVDVVTPVTYERYCGAYRGSFMSFAMTPSAKQGNHPGTISGIKNLYVAGQWIGLTGGLPTAAAAGKFAIQRICKAEGKTIKF